MPPTLYRETEYSLTHLVEGIKDGNIALPDIQRPLVWLSAKTHDIFDSLYRGYPVGTLMFWETGAEVEIRHDPNAYKPSARNDTATATAYADHASRIRSSRT